MNARTITTEGATIRPSSPPIHVHGSRLSITGARKRYGALDALRGVDLEVAAGSFTVLLGPSGSGKTTLLRAIAGIERLDSGRIELDSRVVSDNRTHLQPEHRALAMVFQDYALWPHMTVQHNVGYALRRSHLGSREAARRVGETLERVGLGAKSRSYPHELSGGQQQRVALARAIVGAPSLILFDEPLSNLDADLREHLRLEIATMTREAGATAVYITHDQSEAFALADEVAIVNAGSIEQRGTAEEIFRRPASPFVARFTGLAGSIPGTALDVRAETALIKVGEQVLSASVGAAFSAGSAVELMIRPTATALEGMNESRESIGQAIPGRIIDVAYRGRGYDHVIETGHGILTSVFDERPWARGESCLVRIAASGTIAFPAASRVDPEGITDN